MPPCPNNADFAGSPPIFYLCLVRIVDWAGMFAGRRSGSPGRADGSGRLPKHAFGGLRRRRAMPVRRLDARAPRYVARTLATRSAEELAREPGISRTTWHRLKN